MKDVVAFKWKFTYSKNVCFSLWIWPAGHPAEVRLHSRLFQVFVFLTLISGSVLVLHFAVNYFAFTLTHFPQKFCQKTCFEASQVVFWSLWCYKEPKLTIKPFTGRKRQGLLIQMQNISLQSSGIRKKKNFKIVFLVLSSPLFSLLLPNFFISFAGHLVGFIFKILESDERKGTVVGSWNKIFRSMFHGFLLFSPVSLAELCSFWYGFKDLFTLHKLVDKVVLDH